MFPGGCPFRFEVEVACLAVRRKDGLRYWYGNPTHSPGDGIVLACMPMELRLRRLVGFGSGYSPYLTLDINEHIHDGSWTACSSNLNPESSTV